jgi:hypothetical protein
VQGTGVARVVLQVHGEAVVRPLRRTYWALIVKDNHVVSHEARLDWRLNLRSKSKSTKTGPKLEILVKRSFKVVSGHVAGETATGGETTLASNSFGIPEDNPNPWKKV